MGEMRYVLQMDDTTKLEELTQDGWIERRWRKVDGLKTVITDPKVESSCKATLHFINDILQDK